MTTTDRLEYKGLVAWVEVDNKPTPIYSSVVDRKRKNISCFIASEESKCFAVNFRSPKDPRCSLRLRLYLDGNLVAHRFYDKKDNTGKGASIRIKDCWTSETTHRPFVFTPLNTTDDDAYVDKALLAQNSGSGSQDHTLSQRGQLGEITLTVHRMVNLRITHVKNELPEDKTEKIPTNLPIHEKTVKATMAHHQISYGDKVEVRRAAETN